MIYRCLISVGLRCTDGTGGGETVVNLPFPPYPGLGLCGLLRSDEALAVLTAEYVPTTGWFRCSLGTLKVDRTLFDASQQFSGGWEWVLNRAEAVR